MNEFLQKALTDAAVKILERLAAGETITQNEFKIIAYACRVSKKDPLSSLLDTGKNFLPLLMPQLGGPNE